MNLKQLIGLIARIAVGAVLIYSGASKILGATAEFAGALAAYRILPPGWVLSVAAMWPWVELVIGTYLFFGFYTRLCAAAAAGMFVLFLTFLMSAMARGLDLGSCGCFGAGIALSVHTTAKLDGLFLALSLMVFALSKIPPAYSVDSWINGNGG